MNEDSRQTTPTGHSSGVVVRASVQEQADALAVYGPGAPLPRRLARAVHRQSVTLANTARTYGTAHIAPTTPVEAILLDPLLPHLHGETRLARVRLIVETTAPRRRTLTLLPWGAAGLAILTVIGAAFALGSRTMATSLPLLLLFVSAFTVPPLVAGSATFARIRRTLTPQDALALAWKVAETHSVS